jgi:hypothetical protein
VLPSGTGGCSRTLSPLCRNAFVLQHIRGLIANTAPMRGDLLEDLPKIMTECSKNFVRPPTGARVDIRYDERLQRMLGGSLTAEQVEAVSDELKTMPPSDDLVKAKSKTTKRLSAADLAALPANAVKCRQQHSASEVKIAA